MAKLTRYKEVLYLSTFQKGALVKRFWCGLVFCTGLLQGAMCVGNTGTMEGILSSKGDTWIEVLDDGNYLHRFIPEWIGQGPANGGSFKPETILLLNDLVVGNRISVRWSMDQHLRLVGAQILPPKTQGGIFIGYILKTSNRWIDAQNIDEGKPWRFYLPWVGGYPSEGGGYDLQILRDLKNRNPTDPIRFSWKYSGRPTVVSFYEEVRDSITPFWVGKKLPSPQRIGVEAKPTKLKEVDGEKVSAPANPFEQLNQGANNLANPFDQLNQSTTQSANPFDQLNTEPVPTVDKKLSPFDQLKSPVVPAVDKSANPFENLPLPKTSPFDLIEQK